MSQTIIHKTINSIRLNLLDTIKSNSKKLIFIEDYLLGENYCEFEQEDALYLLDIIEMDNRELNCIIRSDIEGTLVEDSLDIKSVLKGTDFENTNISLYNSQMTLYNLWLSKGNIGSLNDFLNLILGDNRSQWEKL